MNPDDLFERYVRGLLTDGEREELARLLRTEAGARQFGDFIREWSLLADVSKRLSPVAAPVPREAADVAARGPATRPTAPRVRRWRIGAVAAVAAGLLAGVLAAVRQAGRSGPTAVAPSSPRSEVAEADLIPGPPDPLPDAEAVAAARVALESPRTDPERLLGGGHADPDLDPETPPVMPDPVALSPPRAPEASDLSEPLVPADVGPAVPRYRAPTATRLVERTEASVARLDRAEGGVAVLNPAGEASRAVEGQGLLNGYGLRVDAGASAVVLFPDATRFQIAPDSLVRRLTDGRPLGPQDVPAGKGAFLERGLLSAAVSAQPDGRPLVITTPHAEARIQGTRFTLTVSPKATRLDVEQGRVRFTRRADGAAVDLAAGQFAATDAMGAALLRLRERSRGPDVVRLLDDFEGPLRWYHADWSAPMECLLSPDLFHSPRLSFLVSFRPPEKDADARAVLVRPVRLRSVERYLRFHARVAVIEGRPEWSVSLREKDGDHWHAGSGAFEHLRAAKGWSVFEVPVPDGSPDFAHHGDGDGRFEPADVTALLFSVGGGRVVFFLDTVLAVEEPGREVPFPVKPARAGGR